MATVQRRAAQIAVARRGEKRDRGFDPARGSFRGWLFRIARNTSINALASRARQPQGSGDTDVMRLLEQQPASSEVDAASFDVEYRRTLLEWAVDRVRDEFSAATWQAFWATGVEGKPAAEVAACGSVRSASM